MVFKEKYFSRYIPLTGQISLNGCLLLREILGSMCIVIINNQVVASLNFEIKLNSNQALSLLKEL